MSATIQAGDTYQFNLAVARVVEITEDGWVFWREPARPQKLRRVPLWFFEKHADSVKG